MSDYPKSPGGIYLVSTPEQVGPVPARTELTPLPTDPPDQKKIGWMCYEVRGTDIYLSPDGHLGVFQDQADLEQYLTADRLLTTRDALKPGMKLLVHDLFGWSIGMVLLDPQGNPRVLSQNGKRAYVIDFVNDRLAAADGTPAPPRWVCLGSVNLAGLQRLTLHVEEPPK